MPGKVHSMRRRRFIHHPPLLKTFHNVVKVPLIPCDCRYTAAEGWCEGRLLLHGVLAFAFLHHLLQLIDLSIDTFAEPLQKRLGHLVIAYPGRPSVAPWRSRVSWDSRTVGRDRGERLC